MRIGRYKYRGRGGAIKGCTQSLETRHKISEGMIRNNQTSQIYLSAHKHVDINKLHGDAFYNSFDKYYGLEPIMISGACGMMK